MHSLRSIVHVVAGALTAGAVIASPLGAQRSTTRDGVAPSLRDTVGVLLAIAERGDINLRRAPQLVPAGQGSTARGSRSGRVRVFVLDHGDSSRPTPMSPSHAIQALGAGSS